MFTSNSTPHNYKDITGERYARLTVVRRVGRNKLKNILWLCRCDCGNEITVTTAQLRSGNTQSCGCLQRERASKRFRKHYGKGTPEYAVWERMRSRCNCVTDKYYHRYGGRGITVCPEWDSFERFIADMGPRPTPKHSIDRIDNDGNYEKDNCRWATAIEQANNKSSTIRIEFNGETRTITEWSDALGISRKLIRSRLQKGWTVERALTEPLVHWVDDDGQVRNRVSELEFDGRKMNYAAWERELGFPRGMIWKRLRRGWSVEKTMTTPPLSNGEWQTSS